MKFLSGYNIKIIVYWGEFSAGGGELPLIPSVKKTLGRIQIWCEESTRELGGKE